jgi:hypothetical protein
MVASQFAEAQSHFKHRLVNHAFAAPLRANSTGLFNPIVLPFELQIHSGTMYTEV